MGRYNDRIRALGGGKRGKRKFLRLFTNVKRSKAYHGLTLKARCLLFELIDRYTGINNGFIGLGVREAKYELGIGTSGAGRAFQELDDAGLARPTKLGAWRGKQATEWRLMFLRCDKTGDLPVNDWEQRENYRESHQGNTKVPPWEHREALSPTRGTQKPKSSMNEVGLSPTTGSHIDIYQGLGKPRSLPQRARSWSSPSWKPSQINKPQTTLPLFHFLKTPSNGANHERGLFPGCSSY